MFTLVFLNLHSWVDPVWTARTGRVWCWLLCGIFLSPQSWHFLVLYFRVSASHFYLLLSRFTFFLKNILRHSTCVWFTEKTVLSGCVSKISFLCIISTFNEVYSNLLHKKVYNGVLIMRFVSITWQKKQQSWLFKIQGKSFLTLLHNPFSKLVCGMCFGVLIRAEPNMPDEWSSSVSTSQSLQSLEGSLAPEHWGAVFRSLLCQVCRRLPMSVQVWNFLGWETVHFFLIYSI